MSDQRPARPWTGYAWSALAILGLALLALLAFMGAQSRLMGDDYVHFVIGRSLGPWETLQSWRESWNGSYSYYFLHGLIAPFAEVAPKITPAIIILLLTAGSYSLVHRGLGQLSLERYRTRMALALTACIAGVGIHAQVSPMSFYYFSASVRYLLPVALLVNFVAASLHCFALHSRMQLACATLAGTLLCFVIAGFSEIYLVFQFAFLLVAIAAAYLTLKGRKRRNALVIFGGGWSATLASLAVQISAPGVSIRRDNIREIVGEWDSTMASLVTRSIGETLALAFDAESFAAFLLMFCLGLFTMLVSVRPPETSTEANPNRASRHILYLGFLTQLAATPLIYSHTSDNPWLFGRYSPSYVTILAIHALFLSILALLLAAPDRFRLELARYRGGGAAPLLLTLLLVLALFALTQFRAIHWRALAYLVVSCSMLLIMITWRLLQLSSQRSVVVFLFCIVLASVLPTAAAIAPQLYTNLKVIPRTLTMWPFVVMFLGGVWGTLIGWQVRLGQGARHASGAAFTALRAFSYSAVLSLALLFIARNLQLAPSFAAVARGWDARQQYITEQREAGRQQVRIAPLAFDLPVYMKNIAPIQLTDADKYYGVDSLVPDNRLQEQ